MIAFIEKMVRPVEFQEPKYLRPVGSKVKLRRSDRHLIVDNIPENWLASDWIENHCLKKASTLLQK